MDEEQSDIIPDMEHDVGLTEHEGVECKVLEEGRDHQVYRPIAKKPTDDLLYMYRSKENSNVVPIKIEPFSPGNSFEGSMFSPYMSYEKFWPSLSSAGNYTQAMENKAVGIMQEEESKHSLIRLKSEDELLEKKETQVEYPNPLILKLLNESNLTSPSTLSPPLNVKPGVRRGVSCIMWVHLQATICTEWAQERLVLKQGDGNSRGNSSIFHQDLKSLHDLQASNHKTSSGKAPRTIHRCILKTSSTIRDPRNKDLECHVCNTSYQNYSTYFTHLIDNTCMRYQEENRISNTRMTIYAPRTETESAIQSILSFQKRRRTSRTNKTKSSTNPKMFPSYKNYASLDINAAGSELDFATQNLLSDYETNTRRNLNTETANDSRLENIHGETSTSYPAQESDSDPDVQIISEQMKRTNNEPPPKKIRIAEEDSAEAMTYVETDNDIPNINERFTESNEEESYTEAIEQPSEYMNKTSSNFDEKAASETLLLLSSSSQKKTEETGNQAVQLAEPEVTSSNCTFHLPVLCPCEAARRLTKITVEENAADEAHLANFTAKLTGLLTKLLGERRLTQLGFPEISGQEVLEKVLRLTGTTITREDNLCTENCKVEKDRELQRKYRFLKSRIIALEMNTEAFLKICTPDEEIWEKFGWRGKKVTEIITKIVDTGLPAL